MMTDGFRFEWHPTYLEEIRAHFVAEAEGIRQALSWLQRSLNHAESPVGVVRAFRGPRTWLTQSWLTQFRAHVACELYFADPASHAVCEALCTHLSRARLTPGGNYQLANCYSKLGVTARQSGRLADAIRLTSIGLKRIEHLPTRIITANLLYSLAIALERQTEFRDAVSAFQRCAKVEEALGRPHEAKKARDRAIGLEEYTECGAAELSHIFKVDGQRFRQSGDCMRALVQYELALNAAVRSGDADLQAGIIHNIAAVHFFQHEYDKAIGLTQSAIRTLGPTMSRKNLGQLHSSLGAAYAGNDMLDEAMRAFHLARTLAKETNDETGEAVCLHGIGEILSERGEFEPARKHLERARAIRERVGEPVRLSNTVHELGIVAYRMENVELAESLFRSALKLRQQASDSRGIAESLGVLSELIEE